MHQSHNASISNRCARTCSTPSSGYLAPSSIITHAFVDRVSPFHGEATPLTWVPGSRVPHHQVKHTFHSSRPLIHGRAHSGYLPQTRSAPAGIAKLKTPTSFSKQPSAGANSCQSTISAVGMRSGRSSSFTRSPEASTVWYAGVCCTNVRFDGNAAHPIQLQRTACMSLNIMIVGLMKEFRLCAHFVPSARLPLQMCDLWWCECNL